jgi:hypothetical protein
MRIVVLRAFLLSLGLLLPAAAKAQAAAQTEGCTGAEYRSLDFLVGHWRVVHTKTGKLMGQNQVEWINLGCAIRESLTFPGHGIGSSLNFYSAIDQRWHGHYHDSGGLFANFEGTMEGGRHVVSTTVRFPQEPQRAWNARQTTFVDDAGRPRQIGERRNDATKPWEEFYDVTFCPLAPQKDETAPCR